MDTELEGLREQVSDVDRAIIEAINRRLELVRRIWTHKHEHGLGQIDPERERWLHEHVAAANRGPLSQEGLNEIYAEILALTKRELSRRPFG